MKTSFTTTNLNEICRPKQWPTISQSQLTISGYPVFGANGKIGYYSEYNHLQPTILITCRGATCGTINVCEPESYVTGNAMALDDLDVSRADLRFTFYALRYRGLRDAITGTAQPQITRTSLSGIQIPLPPLAEQKRIADILDKADAIRRKRQQAIEEFEKLRASIFSEMFSGKFANAKWTDLNEYLVELRYGTSDKSGVTGYTALRIPNIVRGVIDLTDLKTVNVSDVELEKLRLVDGDVLFVRTNGNPDYVGRCAVFEASQMLYAGLRPNEIIYASYLIRARLQQDQLRPVFLQSLLQTPVGRKNVREKCRTSAGQYNINTKGIGSLQIPRFDIEEQLAFEQQVASLRPTLRKLRTVEANSNELFSSLVQRAFAGEL